MELHFPYNFVQEILTNPYNISNEFELCLILMYSQLWRATMDYDINEKKAA